MPILTEDLARTGHYLVSEAHGYRSRDKITVASGSGVLKAGRVMAKVTATGKWTSYTPGAADGSQNAAAILYEGCDATSADVKRVASARDCEVQIAVLNWGPSVTTEAHKNTALAALAVLGIIGR